MAGKVQQASADLSRLDDVLEHKRDWRFTEAPDAPPAARAAGRLSLQGVSFGYSSSGPPLIENFSLEAEPGQWVALVGESGSGKSTLGKLVTGLFEPQCRADPDRWLQLAFLGPRTLVEHRSVGRSGHPPVQWHGPRQCHPMGRHRGARSPGRRGRRCRPDDRPFENLPGNFQGIIEEGGRNLNGGQRQRVEIARALVREPAILVLDEATAALDAASEHEILTAVRRRGMTCILVAHRLSTIRDCDEIIVLERGKVVERGTHASLMAKAGRLCPADPRRVGEDEPARTANGRCEVAGTRDACLAWAAVAAITALRNGRRRSRITRSAALRGGAAGGCGCVLPGCPRRVVPAGRQGVSVADTLLAPGPHRCRRHGRLACRPAVLAGICAGRCRSRADGRGRKPHVAARRRGHGSRRHLAAGGSARSALCGDCRE